MGKFIQVATTDEIEPGGAKGIEIEGRSIAIFNVDGTFYAISDECTHVGGTLSQGTVDGDEVTCPWHGARFKISTGEVLTPPAGNDVEKYNVKVEGDTIQIEI